MIAESYQDNHLKQLFKALMARSECRTAARPNSRVPGLS
jgi:hypothetical protein